MKTEIKSEDGTEDKLGDRLKYKCKRFIDTEDFELITGLGVASLLSAIFVIGGFLVMIFTFFYGSPELIIWSVLLLMLKIRVCNGGIDISLQGIIQKYFKIHITFT